MSGWATWTPEQRAAAIRTHGRMPIRFSVLCQIFNLTADGAWEILKGDVWRPEYDMETERLRRLEMIRAAVRACA